ncbi:hypothetical protein [Mucilaginibacter glaciei]|uniref:Uncharacterized protein n=1 Tax=Mucilaginibacter glaciei TaxID=2772109 RepID=A0A926S7D2_9SPHI|nr:hypothetical protein [Mucilaginibacter glaciei]MBD1394586.1 hypothetical protein [Mucilaginibacter glaciei]
MHIAYSALRPTNKTELKSNELQQRLDAYQAICEKYSREIAAIQKYLPGWTPAFERKG